MRWDSGNSVAAAMITLIAMRRYVCLAIPRAFGRERGGF